MLFNFWKSPALHLAIFVLIAWAIPKAIFSSVPALSGTVKAAEGRPLEGVAVSARATDKTYTTTVFTDQLGEYSFPPLAEGPYAVWAQAVGFEVARAAQSVSAGKSAVHDFTLPVLRDFSKQVNGDEIAASLPEDTPANRRMKEVFLNTCTGCHPVNFALQNKFDPRGWRAIINFMLKTDMFGVVADPNRAAPVMKHYEDELVEYLSEVSGPLSPPLNYKLVPRPTGEAAQAVVTEFDLPPGNRPDELVAHNGTIWSEGTPSAHESHAAHDLTVDQRGIIWFADQINPERTIGRLDPVTGRVTGYKLAGKDGVSVGTHGISVDANGNVWFTNTEEGSLSEFDPKTEHFKRFPRPELMSPVSRTIVEVDSKGGIWAVTYDGTVRLDPRTGKYTEYKSPTPGGNTYGIAVDAKDNAWWAQMGSDRLGIADLESGKASEFLFQSRDDVEITEQDREAKKSLIATATSGFPDQKGPRRLGADKNGDTIWVAEFYADRLARININTKQIKEYTLPHPYTRPYTAAVDKNHMVWVALMNTDRLAKFDPFTEKFTEYLLPTRGTEIRHLVIDNSTTPPTIWVSYFRTNKIARIQLPPISKAVALTGGKWFEKTGLSRFQ